MILILGSGLNCKRRVLDLIEGKQKFILLGPKYYGPPLMERAEHWEQGDHYLDFIPWMIHNTHTFTDVNIYLPHRDSPKNTLLQPDTTYLWPLQVFTGWLELVKVIETAQAKKFEIVTVDVPATDHAGLACVEACQDILLTTILRDKG